MDTASFTFDIDPSFDENVALEVIAVCLFLNDGRFWDLRGPDEKAGGYSASYQNCVEASIFLSMRLQGVDPESGWHAVYGTTVRQSHAFVLDRQYCGLADVTGDQFGLSSGILMPFSQVKHYRITDALVNHPRQIFTEWNKKRIDQWNREWDLKVEDYRIFGQEILNNLLSERFLGTVSSV
jgi:hypothetical protein